jgi:hypothetical protein
MEKNMWADKEEHKQFLTLRKSVEGDHTEKSRNKHFSMCQILY